MDGEKISSATVSVSIHRSVYLYVLVLTLNFLSAVEIIRAKGLERINLEDLVEELLPRGRSLVPSQVKEDLLGQIKVFLENDPDYRRLSGF